MQIERLRIRDFRCLAAVDVRPGTGVNVIVGDNASGKTSVLEAVFLLGRGRLPRIGRTKTAVRRGADRFSIVADLSSESGTNTRLGVEQGPRGLRLARDGDHDIGRLVLVNTLPLQLIDPNLHRLLEQGPRYRRHFMDWGVFHVEQAFFPAWRRYRRALGQRNRLLKQGAAKKDVIVWDRELVQNGELIDASRRAYIAQLEQALPAATRALLGGGPATLAYECGWRGEQGLGAALAANLTRDQKARHTQQGPHRADLTVHIEQTAARDWVSRGQQKVLTAALLLVQARTLFERKGVAPVLLIDDIAAELGMRYRQTIAEEIVRLGGQSFLTFLDTESVPDGLRSARMFHVERGALRPQ